MTIKRGNVVSHSGANEWGVGKVVEVTDLKATIQFSDGVIRKIASSHYMTLQPADPASYVSPADSVPVAKVRAATKRVKKVKELAV
jgi:transcription elongation factor GreA-like protein